MKTKVKLFPDPDLPPGPYQAFPLIRIIRHLAGQQNFDASAEKIPRRPVVRAHGLGTLSAAVAVEPCREHPRIVQHQQVGRPQQAGEIAKAPVLPVLDPANSDPASSQAFD